MEILPNLEEITRRCHTILAASVGHPTEPLRKDQPAGSPGMTQKTVYVSMDVGAADASIDELMERYFSRACYNLSSDLPKGTSFAQLELPRGVFAARCDDGDISLRAAAAMLCEPIMDKDGELIGKGPESLTVRLDVLVCQP